MEAPIEELGDLLHVLRAKSNFRLKLLEIPEICHIFVEFILNLDVGNLELSEEEKRFLDSDKSFKKLLTLKTHKARLNIFRAKEEDYFAFLANILDRYV
jgi:hypothetical protein